MLIQKNIPPASLQMSPWISHGHGDRRVGSTWDTAGEEVVLRISMEWMDVHGVDELLGRQKESPQQ